MAPVTLTLKPSKGDNFNVDIDDEKTVLEFKQAVAEKSEIPAAEQRLVYKGRLLKDNETLKELKVESGFVIHLVRGMSAATAPPTTTPAPTPAAAPQGQGAPAGGADFGGADPFAALGGLGGLGGMGNGMGGLDLGAALQMMQNPMVQQVTQQMMQNPQMMQAMFQNPMMQQMMQNNPLLQQVTQDPQAMQQMFNPQMMQMAMQMLGGGAGGANGLGGLGGGLGTGTATGVGGANAPQAQAQPGIDLAAMLNMMGGAGGLGGLGGGVPAGGNAREAYASQLQQLRDMGFPNDDANLAILQQCGGNVNLAIERLVNS